MFEENKSLNQRIHHNLQFVSNVVEAVMKINVCLAKNLEVRNIKEQSTNFTLVSRVPKAS